MTYEGAIKVLSSAERLNLYPAVKVAIKALREASLIGNCDGCINDQCDMCIRWSKRADMYEVENDE